MLEIPEELDYRRHFPTTGRNVQVISVENAFFVDFFTIDRAFQQDRRIF